MRTWLVVVKVEGHVEAGFDIASHAGMKLVPEGLDGVGDGHGAPCGLTDEDNRSPGAANLRLTGHLPSGAEASTGVPHL